MAKGSSTVRLNKPKTTVDVDALLDTKGKAEYTDSWNKFNEYVSTGGNNNTLAGYISKNSGGDTPPKVMDNDDFERAVAKGDFIEVGYRTVSTLDQARQFAFGKESFDGKGYHGDGHYLAMYGKDVMFSHDDVLSDSQQYAWRWDYPITKPGHTLRIGIKKSAKIGTMQEVEKYMHEHQIKDYYKGSSNNGLAMAAKKMGLDGYRAPSYSKNGYLVLLNRNAAVVDGTALRCHMDKQHNITSEKFKLK